MEGIIGVILLLPTLVTVEFGMAMWRERGPFQSYRQPKQMCGLGWGRSYPHNIKGMPRRVSGGSWAPGPLTRR
jgi:hypothetical protein